MALVPSPSRFWVLLTLGLIHAPLSADAQLLQTVPEEAHVEFDGELNLGGRAPISLVDLPWGSYDLIFRGPGLAVSRAHVERDANGTRFHSWAGPSALLAPPGLPHLMRSDRRGWIHLGVGLGGGLSLWSAQNSLDDAQDRRGSAQTRADLEIAEQEESDEEKIRNLWIAYTAASWVSSGIEAWLLTPGPSMRLDSTGHFVATLDRADRWAAAMRSALVPGAGQRYLGSNQRALVFSALVAGSLAGAIYAQDALLEARRDVLRAEQRLDAATDADAVLAAQAAVDDAVSDRDSRNTIRWVAFGAAVYSYAWNVVDAYRTGRRAERSAMSWSVLPTSEGAVFALSWPIP